jgi:hypothetical protein
LIPIRKSLWTPVLNIGNVKALSPAIRNAPTVLETVLDQFQPFWTRPPQDGELLPQGEVFQS